MQTTVQRTRHLCGDALNIWSGNDDQTLPMLALGAKGVISVASNIVPQVLTTLCAAALGGDFFTARAIHEAYAGLFDALDVLSADSLQIVLAAPVV